MNNCIVFNNTEWLNLRRRKKYYLVAALLGFAAIFANFGPAWVGNVIGISGSVRMFDYMLGNKDSGLEAVPAMTWLFCCELLIMLVVVAVIVLYALKTNKKDRKNIATIGAGALAVLCLAGGITAFCTLAILGLESGKGDYASLSMGIGAIISGIMLLVAFLGFAAYIVLSFLKKGKKSK